MRATEGAVAATSARTGNRDARLLLAAHLQSSLGTGAGYVALLVLARERFDSAWIVSAVLLADLVPSIALGPVLGALADRIPKRRCLITADLLRAAALVAVALSTHPAGMIGGALIVGVGNALFFPAAMGLLPELAGASGTSRLIGRYGACRSIGDTVGPLIAGLMTAVLAPALVVAADGATYLVSAFLLVALRTRGLPAAVPVTARGVGHQALVGVRVALGDARLRVIFVSMGALALCAGMISVGEVFLSLDALHAGPSGFALLVGAYGSGVTVGSLLGARGRPEQTYRRGIAALAVGVLASATAPSVAVAIASFAVTGIANGAVITAGRVLLDRSADPSMRGRVFGLLDSATATAMLFSLVGGATLTALAGPRALFAVSGAGIAVVAASLLVIQHRNFAPKTLPANG